MVDTAILSFSTMKQNKYHSVFYILGETLELRVYGSLYWVHLVKLELIFSKPLSFCSLGLESTREKGGWKMKSSSGYCSMMAGVRCGQKHGCGGMFQLFLNVACSPS